MHPFGRYPFGPSFPFCFPIGTFIAVTGVGLLVFLAVDVVICPLLSTCYSRIPSQFRQQEPGLVWLLMIPCFGLVDSSCSRTRGLLQGLFRFRRQAGVGDCGKGRIGVCELRHILHRPLLRYLAWPAAWSC